ncbi:MAG: hypothetical protein AVDCRST_MAG65-2249 [uncultured Solirubrobacteraceae bacterium]|uniref:GAF domain-containing protein n=1 Tax=uncultured Solirubrobacteraceae bacterium TaxID=1162706 RepID=A0A6J4SKS4_9ACTN|nr:MAG: hypothetical protein AVDCRST_MAG65-2249 [uncultured Solirubrobacteraceae bacterium]
MSSLGDRYANCFSAYLSEPREETLQAAYELGRTALQDGSSILDLAVAHHAALRTALAAAPAEATLSAAEDFFLESVAAFEVVQRGFREARDSAALQRRHAEMLRQLADFLADASLALHTSDSIDEMLQLVCEQGRELAGAVCCMVTLGEQPQARFRAASYPEDEVAWKAFVRWIDLSRVDAAVRDLSGPLRIPASEVRELIPAPGAPSDQVPLSGEWLGVALCALDGRRLGAMHLIDGPSRIFDAVDEAVVAHLGQMASAAVERALLYAEASGRHLFPGPAR